MSNATCQRAGVYVFNTIIFALGVASIVLNAIYDINNYYYYPCAVVLLAMVFGIVGACVGLRVLLIISAIMCWVFVAIEIANIIVIWLLYDRCIRSNTDYCYLSIVIDMTVGFSVCLVLLILSASFTISLSRKISTEKMIVELKNVDKPLMTTQ